MKKDATAIDIPGHLLPFITTQDASKYTASDHICWRFIMRISKAFFEQHAHLKYLEGLKQTGISIDRIPLIPEMDKCLQTFGWRAVGVSGFIPTSVFIEFQSLRILPIACDMRKIENVAYTPAPDIVHEAAGHAPFIADSDFRNFLVRFGNINRKAIYSIGDMNVYEGIRNLSEVKERPTATKREIAQAQKQLDLAITQNEYVSESTYLARLAWWTNEYGLVGDLHNPKIYGAGLLSSVGESQNCLNPEVLKLPLTLDVFNMSYDITRPQPQLFVAKNFESMIEILETFASTMAFRVGGEVGLAKAKAARTTTTAELDSGIQIAGILNDFFNDQNSMPCYLQYKGPTQLAFDDRVLDGHDSSVHLDGFGTPVGPLKNFNGSPADLSTDDLSKFGFSPDFSQPKKGKLEFESGVAVEGILTNIIRKNSKNIILSFADCKVSLSDQILFHPSWGNFDMACGNHVSSVFGGAADRATYIKHSQKDLPKKQEQKCNLTDANRPHLSLYEEIRKIWERSEKTGRLDDSDKSQLDAIVEKAKDRFPNDWLIRIELLEFNAKYKLNAEWETSLRKRLAEISEGSEGTKKLIQRGMALFE